MGFEAAAFEEDTEFERFVLDRLGTHRVRPSDPASVHDIRGEGPGTPTLGLASIVAGAELVDEFRRSLRPVGFGAAYKVLDMLVEHILRANGVAVRGYASKAKAAKRLVALPDSAEEGLGFVLPARGRDRECE